MKKICLLFFAILYMGISCGFAVDIHYCMGKRVGIEFWHNPTKKCGKCGMKEKKGGCCQNDHQFYKLQDAHKKGNEINFLQQFEIVLPKTTQPALVKKHFHTIISAPIYHPPPSIVFAPKNYILFCTYRI